MDYIVLYKSITLIRMFFSISLLINANTNKIIPRLMIIAIVSIFVTAIAAAPHEAADSFKAGTNIAQLGGGGGNITQPQQPAGQPQLQQQPIIQPHEEVDSFKASGKIKSDIITSSSKWSATGDWNMVVEDNDLQLFKTNMAWTNATSGHTHEFSNFESEDGDIVLPPDNILSIKGNMDVGTNSAISWEGVPTTIDIGGGGKTITISLDHEETDHHFAGQPISGVVTSLTPCSDTPGPSMEVSPSCS